ncbi:CDP-diacylglycerol--inositol 3-phosphatidyltransferase [Trichinella nelsoni]|uniref:CDP-diacylglycerol--inositol 3-phosphatidyltransferase n=1 Tax=Trichinella nelsoni TaxID=6336 RepID=A0A0V0RFS3_9BILA|nr:CDP-diacylglycerol--inositol 3-phosphatidyltransferase [Trichinella nelsoni]
MENNIFLFVPNIIGYIRILLIGLSCFYMSRDCVRAALYYLVSCLLDAVDGYAARFFNQNSRFGAMLDMLTDRCTTLCLLFVLCHFYPNLILLFQMIGSIDIASHWLHMHWFIEENYYNDISGGKSHKTVTEDTHWLLKFYYTSRTFLFFMCLGNEAFFWLLYVGHFTNGPAIPLLNTNLIPMLAFIFCPVAALKTAISLVHLASASRDIARIDAAEIQLKVTNEKVE